MSSNLACRRKDEYRVNQTVWARHFHDGLYWPARITSISSQRSATTNHQEPVSYFVVYFHSNQNSWTSDVLPYQEYRAYFAKHLMAFYQSNGEWRNHLIKAMNQADQYIPIPPSDFPHPYQESSAWNYSCQNPSTSWCQSYPCCTSTYYTDPNDNYGSANIDLKDFNNLTAAIIVTHRNYASPSFLSHLHHSLAPFTHRFFHYIDSNNINPHPPLPPTASNIIYLICLDHHSTIIDHQTLDMTILHNLQPHLNYYFLVVNSPSQSLINHVYEQVTEKRSILVLQYHASFDESSMLMCSGERETFENLSESFLKYLSPKIKYVDAFVSFSSSDESSTLDTNQILIQTKKNKTKSMPSKLLDNYSSECNVKNILEQTESKK